METSEAEARVRRNVLNAMSRLGMSNADLARAAGIDNGTVGDFLAGNRWPKGPTRAKISTALNWPPEGIELILQGHEPSTDDETVSPRDQDEGVLLSMPAEALEGLSAAEREEVIAAARLSALRTAREIRRRLNE